MTLNLQNILIILSCRDVVNDYFRYWSIHNSINSWFNKTSENSEKFYSFLKPKTSLEIACFVVTHTPKMFTIKDTKIKIQKLFCIFSSSSYQNSSQSNLTG